MHLSTKQEYTILDALKNEAQYTNSKKLPKLIDSLKKTDFKDVAKHSAIIEKSVNGYYHRVYRSTIQSKNRILRALKNVPNLN